MRSAKQKTFFLDGRQMRASRNKGHVVPRQCQISADNAADAAGAKNRKFHLFPSL